ncbi:T9SS type A sorting domain-containing protein [Flavobacterium sp.]|uniref:DUF7619 domain-containing protein n=1 Tax=Flavobacterium sp. TaxID=239 RepID=UPI0026173040|nr:T9SS type A sorting domain-containing protein [Flavobacterium sp.]
MKHLYFTLLTLFFFATANAQIVTIPDAIFKAKLIAASASNQIATNLSGTYFKIDANNDGQIQNTEALAVTYLDVSYSSISDMTGIQAFTNLQGLLCYNNQLTALNLQGLTNLQVLYCQYNQLTALNVQGLTNLHTLQCNNNQLPTLNAEGLTNLQTLKCSNNQLTTLNVQGLTNLQFINCYNNQLPTLNVQGLTNLGYLACSYNQLPTLNVQGLTNLHTLQCTNNQLPTLNVQGLTNLQELNCFDNQLTTLNVQGLTNLNNLYCQNNQLTNLFVKNGRNENIVFSGNPNITYICADDSEITSVQNLATGYGYTNCNVNGYCSFTPGGMFYTINGTNKYDSNTNGCDALDISLPNLKFNITDGIVSGSIITNTSGNYAIPVQAGTYTITPVLENPTFFTVAPATATVTFPATASPFSQNFCIMPNGVHHDLEVVVISLLPARPGFDATYKIKYKNKGNLNETATVNFNYNEAILDYVSSSLVPTTQAVGTLSWNVGTIAPFQTGEIIVTLNVNSPMETPAVNGGDVLSYTATANGLTTDETPDDNTFALSQTVFNSFDPNDKTCLEGATINPSMIGKYVHYKIRFENTGTFAAQNIVVKDMIDISKFDISSLQMIDASHSCTTRINGNKVEFIFENINLPFDDANNDGYVVFKIKTKSTLVVGNTISNQANIYFDYNFPIITNTATSTFQALNNDAFVFENEFVLYPNPAKNLLHIEVKNEIEISSISIYNMLGQVVLTTTNPSNTIEVSNLKTGNYFIKVTTDKGTATSKFIKE